MAGVYEHVKRYRDQAHELWVIVDELRVIAERCQTQAARKSYLWLAAQHEAMAIRADAAAKAAVAACLELHTNFLASAWFGLVESVIAFDMA